MSTIPSSIWAQALALPENERVQLAGELLASVRPPGALSVDDPSFLDTVARRQAELRDGTAKTYSADETLAAMRRALAQQNEQ
jgi:hypothetical protein